SFEPARGFFVRPGVAIGEAMTFTSGNANSLFAALRLDACAQLPGNYPQSRGLEFAPCGGADFGFTYFPAGHAGSTPEPSTTLPQVCIGPSVNLRGDLGPHWSLVLRVVAGVNVIHKIVVDSSGNYVEPDWFS